MPEYEVQEVRATGRTPEAVTEDLNLLLKQRTAAGWKINTIQPIIYNSSTTGYLLLFFEKES